MNQVAKSNPQKHFVFGKEAGWTWICLKYRLNIEDSNTILFNFLREMYTKKWNIII